MKRLVGAVLLLSIFLVGCKNETQEVSKADFKFCSAEWGDDWETVQKDTGLEGEVIEKDEMRITVQVEDAVYMDIPVHAKLQFDSETSQSPGLCNVALQYEEQDEERLIAAMEKVYGERCDSYLDKNGMENPLQSAGWVSEETFEEALSEQEKAAFLKMFSHMDTTRAEAVLRQPLVTIQVDGENHVVWFSGSATAAVKYIKAEMNS